MAFIGRFYHALEQKGRLLIPKALRKNLGDSIVVTQGLEDCLFAFHPNAWHEVVEDAQNLPFTRKNARDWVRLLAGNAHQLDIDSVGRINLPEHLINYAHLEDQVVIAGALSRIELWDRHHYHRYLEKLNQNAATIAEGITQDE